MTKLILKTTIKFVKLALGVVICAALTCAAAQSVQAQIDKFDESLQNDFASGMGGDAAKLEQAMRRAEKILAANPADAETLVWHGSATLSEAGKAYQNGDFRQGAELWKRGLSEMDKAVELAPENFVVRIVRGSTALSAARKFPDPAVAKELREKVVSDYEKILTLSDEKAKKALPKERARVLNGLVEAYEKLGDKAKAETFRAQLAQPQ